MIQRSYTALLPALLTLLHISVDNPLWSSTPVMTGAPYIIIPEILLHGSFMSSTTEQTEENKLVHLVWFLRLWSK